MSHARIRGPHKPSARGRQQDDSPAHRSGPDAHIDQGSPIRAETIGHRIVGIGAQVHHLELGLIVKQLEALDLKLKAWRQGGVPLVEGNGKTEKRVVSRQHELHRQVLVARLQSVQPQTSTVTEIATHLFQKLSLSWLRSEGTPGSTLPAGGLPRQEIIHRLWVCGAIDDLQRLSRGSLERPALLAELLIQVVPRQIGWLGTAQHDTAGPDIHECVSRSLDEGPGELIVGVQHHKTQPEGSAVIRQVSQKGTGRCRLLAGNDQGLSQRVAFKEVPKTWEYA